MISVKLSGRVAHLAITLAIVALCTLPSVTSAITETQISKTYLGWCGWYPCLKTKTVTGWCYLFSEGRERRWGFYCQYEGKEGDT